jgi:hypothetical protein
LPSSSSGRETVPRRSPRPRKWDTCSPGRAPGTVPDLTDALRQVACPGSWSRPRHPST